MIERWSVIKVNNEISFEIKLLLARVMGNVSKWVNR